MRAAAVVLLGACGGGTVTASARLSTDTSATTTTTTLTVDALGPAPEEVDEHLHGVPVYAADADKLYVEITSDGEHADVLRRSASSALAGLPFVISVDDGAELELHVETASLAMTPPPTEGATCKVKMFVMRLPQHDLLAIADGSGHATGASPADLCLSMTGTAVIQQKLPPFLQRQLADKQ